MSLAVVVLLTAAIAYVLSKAIPYLLNLYRIYTFGKKLPGPPSLPLIGDAHHVAFKTTAGYMPFFVGEATRHMRNGETAMRFWNCVDLFVFPLNGETAKSIVDSSEEITKGSGYEIVRPWLGTGLLISTGEKWRSRRKMLTPTFHFNMLKNYVETFNSESRVLISLFDKFAQSGKEVDVFPYVKRCALDIICKTAMGKSISAQTNENHPYVLAVRDMNQLAMYHTLKPWLWFAPIWHLSGYAKKYNSYLDTLLNFTTEIIKERKEEFAKNEKTSGRKAFLDMLLEMRESNSLTDEDIREEVDTFMFEGHDTTASGTGWIIWCLANHPELQEKVYEELNSVIGDSDRDITAEDFTELPYFDRFIKESLRIFPPVPIIQRKMQNDFQMGKYTVPKGAQLIISPMVLHYNEKAFPEPYKFDPDRFLPENAAKRHAYDYIPFSAGLRNCIGQKFALQEQKVMVSWILRRFRISATRPFLENPPCPELVMKPDAGIPVKFTKR